MRAKKIIAGILLTVMVMENSLTSLAAPVANAGGVTNSVIRTEVQEAEAVPETAGEEPTADKEVESGESALVENSSEAESVSSEADFGGTETGEEMDPVEETTEPETVSEQGTAEEPMTDEETVIETEVETLSEVETETVLDDSANEAVAETEQELDYILGRPMTEDEIAEQLSYIPDYMPQIEVMPMGNATDIHAGENMIQMLGETTLPSSYDARDYEIITSVKNQNPWGTCWSFATMSLLESSWIQQYDETLDLSERHMAYFCKNTGYDPLGNASGDTMTPYNDRYYLQSGGNLFRSSLKLMNWHGAAAEADYPYSTTVPAAIAKENAQDKIVGLQNTFFVPTKNATQEEKVTVVKNLIKTYGCVEWSYYHHDDMYYNASTAAYYMDTDAYGTNHSITIVGWDDSYSKENFSSDATPENDGAWLVKNSWGTNFGKNGYMYISYEDMSLGCGNPVAVMIAAEADVYDNNYFYGNTGTVMSAGNFQKIGHVYQIQGDTSKQKITAVSVMVAEDNMPYSVQLYKNPQMTDGVVTNPSSGTPLLEEPVTGTTGYAGLYTIEIPEVTVELDDYVAVVFELESSGWFYFCSSYTGETSDGTVVITEVDETAPGQCFYGYSYGWYDAEQSDYTFMLNLLTENVDETVTVPTLTYTLEAPADFSDVIDCNLKWVKCSDALQYELYRADEAGGEYKKIATIESSSRSYQDQISLADKDKTFYYKLAAVYANDVMEESEVLAVDLSQAKFLPKTDFKQYMNFVLLEWDEISGADGYILEKKTADDTSYTQLADIKNGETLSVKDTEVSLYDEVYEYRVRAYASTGEYSDWKEWSTTDVFEVTQGNGSLVKVKWKKVDGATFFRIRMGSYYLNKENTYSTLFTSPFGIGETEAYYIQMYTSEDAFTNGESPLYVTPYIYFYTVPILADFSAEWDGEEASFTWNALTYAETIAIYRSRNAEDMGDTAYAEIDGTATSYTDTGIDGVGMYYYWFVPKVTNSSGEIVSGEALTAQIEVTVEPVDLLAVTEVTESSVEITWKKHTLADGYSVYRKSATDSEYKKIASISDPERLSYLDENVTIGKLYEYKVVVVVEDGESGLDSAETLQIQTKPSKPVLVNTYMNSVVIQNKPELEYAAVSAGEAAASKEYVTGTDETLTLTGLSENTSYEIYARTKTDVTGSESVYSDALTVTTKAIDTVSIELEKASLVKDEKTVINALIAAGEETEVYTGEIRWTAVDKSGQECEVLTQGNATCINGTDGKEILRIEENTLTEDESNKERLLTATALSETKEITLTGKIITTSGTELSDQMDIRITVLLEALTIQVESVKGETADSLEGIDIGDVAVLVAEKSPFNADAVTLQWKVQDESVAVITPDGEDDSRAELEIKGLGTTTITVQTSDGSIKAGLEVNVILDPVVMLSATAKNARSIMVSWEKHAAAESYKLYRKDGSRGTYTLLTELNAEVFADVDQITYEDTSVITGKTYFYKVTAVCDGTESGLADTKEVFTKTSPAMPTLAEEGVTYESVTINSMEGLEYAVALPGVDKTTLTYITSSGPVLTFNGLEPNKKYVIYVRSDSAVTGEAVVYGPALPISTMIKAELILSIKDVVLSKGNKLPFSYTITPENLHYDDALVFTAADAVGSAYTVLTMGTSTTVINGQDGKEICRISNGYFYATGESEQKEVYVSVKRGSLEAGFHVKIHVPVSGMEMVVDSVNGDSLITTLDEFKVGETAQLHLSILPANAEETFEWSSSNEEVASVKASSENDRIAEITASGTGSCTIAVTSSDGMKTQMTVIVNKASSLYAIWISDKTDLAGTLVEKDPVTEEYISEYLEKQPVYELNGSVSPNMTIVSYVLESEEGGTIRKAEEADGIIYRSSDSAVVSVTREGVVTAVGNGEADIFAYDSKGNDIYGSCHVIVSGQQENVTEEECPVDQAIKLSAVVKKMDIESFALDEKSKCQVRIKDQYGKIYSSQEELKWFTFSSSNSAICMVDEMGVVRPNPNYKGKSASVKITAALNADTKGRKVVFTVKVLTEKQIDRIALECVSASDTAQVTPSGMVDLYEKGKMLTFKSVAYDSKGTVIENPRIKFAVSDTKVAKVKDNKDGTVTVTMNKAGRVNLTATGNDVWKKTESIQIHAIDTKLGLSKSVITLNKKAASQEMDEQWWKTSENISVRMPEGTEIVSFTVLGASIGRQTLNNEELAGLKWSVNEDGTYALAVKEAYLETLAKNAKLVVDMQAEVKCDLLDETVKESFRVTAKINSQEPKISVSEAKSINRFYVDKDETLLILKTPSIITEAEVLDNPYFTVTELKHGQWYLKFSDPDGTYNAKKASVKLRLTAQGYEAVEKKLTVQTPYKAPALKQQNIPLIHWGNDQLHQAEIVLYDKTTKQELSEYAIADFTSSRLEEGEFTGNGFYVTLRDDITYKNNQKVSAQVGIQAENWVAPVKLSVAVKVSTKIPKLNLQSSKITLNLQAKTEQVKLSLSADQKNVEFTPDTEWKLQMYDADSKSWLPTTPEYRNDWLKVSYNISTQKIEIGIKEGSTVLAGSCKFRISNVIEGFETVYKDFTVKVVDVKPTVAVTVKGKQDLINRENGSLVGTMKFKNAVSSKVTDVTILSVDGTELNPTYEAQLLSDGRFTIRFTEEGRNDSSLKKQKVTLPVVVTMENGTMVYGNIRFSLTQTNPKVKVPAMQTVYKSMKELTKEFDFASGLADGVKLQTIRIASVPKGFTASYKDGSVVVTLNDRGIKAGTYQIKVNLYFDGAVEGTKPVSKTIKVKVVE